MKNFESWHLIFESSDFLCESSDFVSQPPPPPPPHPMYSLQYNPKYQVYTSYLILWFRLKKRPMRYSSRTTLSQAEKTFGCTPTGPHCLLSAGSEKNLPSSFHPANIRWSWKQEPSSIFSKLSFKTTICSFSRPKMMRFDTNVVIERFLMTICHITPKRNTRNRFFPWRMDTENSHIESERQE